MANFIPPTADNSPQRMLAMANAVNAALRGDTANIGRVTCAAGQSSVTVNDKRCRAGRLALLIPLDSVAAECVWWLDSMTRDKMIIKFKAAPTSDAQFGWALIGDGYEV